MFMTPSNEPTWNETVNKIAAYAGVEAPAEAFQNLDAEQIPPFTLVEDSNDWVFDMACDCEGWEYKVGMTREEMVRKLPEEVFLASRHDVIIDRVKEGHPPFFNMTPAKAKQLVEEKGFDALLCRFGQITLKRAVLDLSVLANYHDTEEGHTNNTANAIRVIGGLIHSLVWLSPNELATDSEGCITDIYTLLADDYIHLGAWDIKQAA